MLVKGTVHRDKFGKKWSDWKGLREARRYSGNFSRPPILWDPCEISQRFHVHWLAIRKAVGNGAHTSGCGFCFTSCKDWEMSAELILNRFPIGRWMSCYIWLMFLWFISRKTKKEDLAVVRFFGSQLTVASLIDYLWTRSCWQILMGIHGRANFAKNLRASPFNKDFFNYTRFSQIYLDGQYLKVRYVL